MNLKYVALGGCAVVVAAITLGLPIYMQNKNQELIEKNVMHFNQDERMKSLGITIDSKKDEKSSSLFADRYDFNIYKSGEDSKNEKIVSLIDENSYGFSSVESVIKFAVNDIADPELKKLLESFSIKSNYSVFLDKVSGVLEIKNTNLDLGGDKLSWGNGLINFDAQNVSKNYINAASKSNWKFDIDSVSYESQSQDKFDLQKMIINVGGTGELFKSNLSLDKIVFNSASDNLFAELNKFESEYKTSLSDNEKFDVFLKSTFKDLVLKTANQFDINNLSSELSFQNLSLKGITDKCKIDAPLNEEKTDKLVDCMAALSEDELKEISITLLKGSNLKFNLSSIVLGGKANLNIKLDLPDSSSILELVSGINLTTDVELDRKLVEKIATDYNLPELKNFLDQYVTDENSSSYVIDISCKELQCKANGKPLQLF